MSFEDRLDDLGVEPAQIAKVAALVEVEAKRRARVEVCEFIARLLVRLDRRSVHGRALAAALGYNGGMSLELAASEFGVTKQYLDEQQAEVERKIADLAAQLKIPA